jgi:hypothetical protein
MYIWTDDMELSGLNHSGDGLSLKDTFNGVVITGEKGCGKTTGSAAHIHAGFLAIGAGGYAPCPKRTDFRDYMRLIRAFGREADVIPMRPSENWQDRPVNAINVLKAEQALFGRGSANASNVTALLMKVSDLIQRQGGQGATNEAFWREYAKKVIHAGLTAQSIVSNNFDLKLLLKFVNELPNTLAEIEERSLYSVALMQEAKAKLGESVPYDFTLVYDFVMREWPLSPPNARASGALTVQVMLSSLLSHPLRQMLFEETTFDLDRVLNNGGILLLDMCIDDYAQAGMAGMILKDLISRACQVRPQLGTLDPQFIQPVYLLVDEYPEYAIEADEKHARMARSARLAPIFITQSTTSLKAQFQDKDKAQAILDLAGCRFAHQNGSFETNEWMAKTIGQVIVQRRGRQKGRNWDYGPDAKLGRNDGENINEQVDYDCPPRSFTRLLRGGLEHKLKTEAIFWRSGEKFKWNGRRWLPCVFPQDFRPGRDEVRITAKRRGGDNHASQDKSVVAYPASQNRWDRLRSLLQ